MPLPTIGFTALGVVVLAAILVIDDITQTKHAVRRVYPILGRLRYLVEKVGPELRQYIVTSDLAERPFTRSQRAWVYQTAMGVNSAVGLGQQHDVGQTGRGSCRERGCRRG